MSVLRPTNAARMSVLRPRNAARMSVLRPTNAARMPVLRPTNAARMPVLRPTNAVHMSVLRPTNAARMSVLKPMRHACLPWGQCGTHVCAEAIAKEEHQVYDGVNTACMHAGPYTTDANAKKLLQKAIQSALEKARDLGVDTLAIPPISTGIFGFDKLQGCRILVTTVHKFLKALNAQKGVLGYDTDGAGMSHQGRNAPHS
jgi:O-acetyl-ADP-ribose deacetylase (regulator of RNase III)